MFTKYDSGLICKPTTRSWPPTKLVVLHDHQQSRWSCEKFQDWLMREISMLIYCGTRCLGCCSTECYWGKSSPQHRTAYPLPLPLGPNTCHGIGVHILLTPRLWGKQVQLSAAGVRSLGSWVTWLHIVLHCQALMKTGKFYFFILLL